MDVLALDLNRSVPVPGASREAPQPERPWRPTRILQLVRRIASGGSGGDAVATRRNGLLAFTAATIALGIGLLATTTLMSPAWPAIDPGIGATTALAGPSGGLLLWLLYGLIGSLRVLRMPGGATMTFHLPFVGAAMILGGPTAGAWVGFLATIERRELETQPWYGILANHSIMVISAVAGGVTTKVVALAMGPDAGGAGLLLPAASGAIVLAAVSSGIAGVTMLLRESLTVRALAEIMFVKFGRITAIECALVVVLALAYVQIGWWAPVLVAGFVLLIWDNDPMPPPDPITGMPVKQGALRILETAVGRLRRGVTQTATILFVDLDHFKWINDNVSYEIGNEVLAEVGGRLRAQARRADDIAGRWFEGDEFVLFLPGLGDPDVSLRRAEEIVADLCRPIPTSAGTMTVGASVGVVVVQAWGGVPSAATLVAQASSAMKAAKAAGGGSALFRPDDPVVKLGNRR